MIIVVGLLGKGKQSKAVFESVYHLFETDKAADEFIKTRNASGKYWATYQKVDDGEQIETGNPED